MTNFEVTGSHKINVLSAGASETVGTIGAIDATVRVGEIEGDVTLVPRESDGVLDSWGTLHHWASPALHGVLASEGMASDVIEAVRLAIPPCSEIEMGVRR